MKQKAKRDIFCIIFLMKNIKKNRKLFLAFLFIFFSVYFFFPLNEEEDFPPKVYAETSESFIDKNVLGFFDDSVDIENLKKRYNRALGHNGSPEDKIKILIVPGHNDKFYGAEFNGLKEVDLNRQLAKELERLLKRKKEFDVLVSDDEKVQNFLKENEEEIKNFEINHKIITVKLRAEKELEFDQKVEHNFAPDEMVTYLYGINKFVNDNNFDIVLHIHFNDVPYRKENKKGKYEGLAIYVPESEFKNGSASKRFGKALFNKLTREFKESNHPVESQGPIEDGELIAVGAYNTVNPIAVLIEYGYIYQSEFRSESNREKTLKKMAYQTYLGIRDFLK
jgi:N-acetylmuramoyl-L-alanine amidase